MIQLSIDKPQELPLAVNSLFFEDATVHYKNEQLKMCTVQLRSGDYIKRIKIGDYIYLEQNPNTYSKYAIEAKHGSKILWIIHAPTNTYIGRVMDKQVVKL